MGYRIEKGNVVQVLWASKVYIPHIPHMAGMQRVKVGTDYWDFFCGHLKGSRMGHHLLFEDIYYGFRVLIFQKWGIERVVGF